MRGTTAAKAQNSPTLASRPNQHHAHKIGQGRRERRTGPARGWLIAIAFSVLRLPELTSQGLRP